MVETHSDFSEVSVADDRLWCRCWCKEIPQVGLQTRRPVFLIFRPSLLEGEAVIAEKRESTTANGGNYCSRLEVGNPPHQVESTRSHPTFLPRRRNVGTEVAGTVSRSSGRKRAGRAAKSFRLATPPPYKYPVPLPLARHHSSQVVGRGEVAVACLRWVGPLVVIGRKPFKRQIRS